MATQTDNTAPRKKDDVGYDHVLRYTGVFGGVQGLKILMDVVRNKLAALLLHKVGMGLNAIYMNTADLINSCTNFGIGFAGVQRISEIYDEGDEYELRHLAKVLRTWSLISALVGGAICLALATAAAGIFPDSSHLWERLLLALFVASLPMEAGECSILKGTRQLSLMACVEVGCTFSTFIFTIPLFFLLGLRGIVISLVLCGWAKVFLHMWASTRRLPYRVNPFSRRVVRDGSILIRRGVPYMLTAIAGSYTTMAVFQYCLDGAEAEIGLYKAAYGLMVTYAGMVFMAMEADYFPRLASENREPDRMNHTINQQIDVCVLLMAPLLIAFTMAMPWIVRLLYSHEFLPIVAMAQCAVFYMFFSAVTKPIAYTSLAKGDSVVFLVVECVYNLAFVGLMYYGYHHYGLLGTGLALSLAGLFDLLLISSVYGRLYGFRLRRSSLTLIVPQGLLLLATVLSCLSWVTWIKYSVGVPCFALSVAMTWRVLSHRSQFVQRVKAKLGRR